MSLVRAGIKGMPQLLRQLHNYPRFIAAQSRALLHKHARALVSSSGKVPGLVQVTPPHSQAAKDSAAKKRGEAAVTRDVWRVYGTPGKAYEEIKQRNPRAAAGFWKAVSNNQWAAAEAIMQSTLHRSFQSFDDGAQHMQRRNNQGRVSGKRPSLYVKDGKAVRGYLKRRQRNVGLLAASISAAYNGRYGALSGVPAWIGRHKGSWAGGSMTERKAFRRGTVIRISVDAGRLNSEMQRRFSYVVGYRVRAMERETPYIIRHAAKKAGLQA